jgi:hypothetical protein
MEHSMSFKENLLTKIKIDRLAAKVVASIGPVESGSKVDKDAMRSLLELSPYQYHKVRDLDLYVEGDDQEQKKIFTKDGQVALEWDDSDGVTECLALFAELLDYKPAPKAFQLSGHKIIGELATKADGEVLFGPMIIYSLVEGTLKLIGEQISSFDKTKIELFHQVADGKQKATDEGSDVFEFLKNDVLTKEIKG